MDFVKLRQARDEAAQGREEIRTKIATLVAREEHLASAIRSLNAVLGQMEDDATDLVEQQSSEKSAVQPNPANDDIPTTGRANWEIAKELLERVNRPMTVPEMMSKLTELGFLIQGDGLRVAMIRRKDVFRKNGYGRYGLTAWPTSSRNTDLAYFGESNEYPQPNISSAEAKNDEVSPVI